jgi:hypothetical protein
MQASGSGVPNHFYRDFNVAVTPEILPNRGVVAEQRKAGKMTYFNRLLEALGSGSFAAAVSANSAGMLVR